MTCELFWASFSSLWGTFFLAKGLGLEIEGWWGELDDSCSASHGSYCDHLAKSFNVMDGEEPQESFLIPF
jgi:hypothetical protein